MKSAIIFLLISITSLYCKSLTSIGGFEIGMPIKQVEYLINASNNCLLKFTYDQDIYVKQQKFNLYTGTHYFADGLKHKYTFMFVKGVLYSLMRETTDLSSTNSDMYELFLRMEELVIAETGQRSNTSYGNIRAWSFPDTNTEWSITYDNSAKPHVIVEHLIYLQQ